MIIKQRREKQDAANYYAKDVICQLQEIFHSRTM